MPVMRSRLNVRFSIFLVAVATTSLLMHSSVFAQFGGGNGGNIGNNFFGVVGGVAIDSEGVLNGEIVQLSRQQLEDLQLILKNSLTDEARGTGRRVVSLSKLEDAVRVAGDNLSDIPLDVAVLGGMQRVTHIVVDSDNRDLLLVGDGDEWTVNASGAIVGANNGLPMLHLEDLIVAMRAVDAANNGAGITVSIDPTEQGVKQYNQLLQSVGRFDPVMAPRLEQAMGPQTISLTGVPASSRFAHILVNADYKMKRLSMGLERSPINKFPSVLEMIQQRNAQFGQMAPRFWMECNYEPVAKSEDGRVWQISGQGVKTLTDEQFFNKNGEREAAGKRNRIAEAWAENMTTRFDELAAAEPAFAELRNVMDLSVIAAIIRQNDLIEKAETDLPGIMGSFVALKTPQYTTPKTVSSQCSFVRTANSWVVTASGGVLLDSWGVASNVESNASLTVDSLNLPKIGSGRIWASANN